MAEEACRVDVWLWRARFFKTRALASHAIEDGRIRLDRHGATTRLDKPSRAVKVGDELVFAQGQRLVCLVVAALGDRRGPPAEARALYIATDDGAAAAIDNATPRLTNTPARTGRHSSSQELKR